MISNLHMAGLIKTAFIKAALTIFLAVAVFIAGCSGGDDDSGTTNTTTPLSLSRTSAAPGEFISLFHGSISADSTVDVTFSGKNGYSITIQSADTSDGVVNVPVPVLIEPGDGSIIEGDITVKLAGVGGPEPLHVNALPSLQGVAPGDVLVDVLGVAIDNYESAIDNLDIIAARENVDNSSATAQLQDRIDSLRAMINELLAFGDLSVELPDGSSVIVPSEQIELIDRILASYAAGMTEHLTSAPAQLKVNPQKALTSAKPHAELPAILQDPRGAISRWAQEMKNKAAPGVRAFGGIMGAIVGLGGLYIGGTVGTVIAVIGGTGIIIAVAGTEIAVSLGANNISSSLRDGKAVLWNSSQELIDIIKSSGKSLVLTVIPLSLPTKLGDAVSVYSAADGIQVFVDNTAQKSCSSNAPPGNFLRIADINFAQALSASFCEVVFGPPPGTGDSNGFKINNIVNLNGENILNPTAEQISSADISISGTRDNLSISWRLSGAVILFVVRAGEINFSYGITGEEIETSTGFFLRPFNPPARYGDYGKFGTDPQVGAQIPSPALLPGNSYAVTVGNEEGDQVLLSFTVQ
jgi:hypothetical protein